MHRLPCLHSGLIRHGEKPADGGVGLSAAGEDRAQCIRKDFGAGSNWNIGLVSSSGA